MDNIKYYMKGITQDGTVKELKGAIQVENKYSYRFKDVFKMLVEKIWNDKANRNDEDYASIEECSKELIIAIDDRLVLHKAGGDVIHVIESEWDALDDSGLVEESLKFKASDRLIEETYMFIFKGEYLYHLKGIIPVLYIKGGR